MEYRLLNALVRQGPLARLAAIAGEVRALDDAFQQQLPAAIAGQCHAVRIRDGELVVFADHGVAAARLRMLGDGLLAALAARGFAASRMRVRVAPRVRPPAREKTIAVGAAGVAALQAASEQVDDAALARALSRMSAHHRL